jgi:hypothetical protein
MEDEMVLAIFRKYVTFENDDEEQLFIKSAFTHPASKGYVYIEADKEIHVSRAIRGLRELKHWKMQLVPLNEMVQAVTFKATAQDIQPRTVWTLIAAPPDFLIALTSRPVCRACSGSA